MAIPNSPNWSSLTDVQPYPQPSFVQPAKPAGVAAVALGPIQLNDSQGVLTSRYWLAVYQDNAVFILAANGSSWGNSVKMFDEPERIYRLSLTFDQLGRPIVFYMTDNNQLKLYWFDPIAQQNVSVNLASGYDPTAVFDFPQDTGQSFTDVLLFYVRGGRVYMRIQRDRYAVEYTTPAQREGLRIVSSGLRVDNRFQLEYVWPEQESIRSTVDLTIRRRG